MQRLIEIPSLLKPLKKCLGMAVFIIPLLFVALIILGGCEKEPVAVTHKQWKAKITHTSQKATIAFSGHQTMLSKKHRHTIAHLVQKSDKPTALYATIHFQVPKTHGQKSLHRQRFQHLKSLFMNYGVPPHRINATYLAPHTFARKNHRSTHHKIKVSIDQYLVQTPKCPGWNVMGNKQQPQRETNFGCITESNFSHMVAEPRDLYKAQELSQGDGPYNANVIEAHRQSGRTKGTGSGSAATSAASAASSLSRISAFIE